MKRSVTKWKKDDIRRALSKARLIVKNKNLDIRIAAKLGIDARLLVVTPRASGIAVKRNQFRRRIRALFHELKLDQGAYDWLIFAKPHMSDLSFATLRELLLKYARSLSVLVL